MKLCYRLSHDLYHKPTRFLMELVQNADDSAYRASTPALNITYKHNLLRIDSNETGFTRRNVEAICRIGRSYKANPGNSRGYIGENGIGFKSVFKVAHVVWIISGPYSFKFGTTSGHLGMIAPIWVDELTLGEALPGFTPIILDLSPRCKPEILIRELKLVDPKLLIFLHIIREIGISVQHDASNLLEVEGCAAEWTTALTRVDSKEEHGSAQHIVLTQNGSTKSFLVFRYQVATLLDDPKRLGWTQSDILLAFPEATSPSGICQTENMYAFLPIRNYGFKFVIHADFLLVANREDIDFSSTWNQMLAKGIPSAFLHAVNEFNRGKFRYTW
ncbi:histidine kinase-like ATPase [Halenospora varia]|nr:histidine kinase-like ATPase [Halenospora varia]